MFTFRPRRLVLFTVEPMQLQSVECGVHRRPWVREGAAFEVEVCDLFRSALAP